MDGMILVIQKSAALKTTINQCTCTPPNIIVLFVSSNFNAESDNNDET